MAKRKAGIMSVSFAVFILVGFKRHLLLYWTSLYIGLKQVD